MPFQVPQCSRPSLCPRGFGSGKRDKVQFNTEEQDAVKWRMCRKEGVSYCPMCVFSLYQAELGTMGQEG